jgi:hypothetical protein
MERFKLAQPNGDRTSEVGFESGCGEEIGKAASACTKSWDAIGLRILFDLTLTSR